MTHSDSTLRQVLGIETENGIDRIDISYQRILDNVHLLNNDTLKRINNVIVDFGHKRVLKKKGMVALFAKTDSFVVESNVHFPSDYNLLWDASRKVLDIVNWFVDKYPSTEGWRKSRDWNSSLKNLSRFLGQSSSSGWKGKAERLTHAAQQYITKATAISGKINKTKDDFPMNDTIYLVKMLELKHFITLLDKQRKIKTKRGVREKNYQSLQINLG
jgi:hypothetical protein